MLRLFIIFILIYFVIIQGLLALRGVSRYFGIRYKKRKPDITVTHMPPKPSQKKNTEGEYVDYEELD